MGKKRRFRSADGAALDGRDENDKRRLVSMTGPGDELCDMLVNQKLRRDTLCPECPWVFSERTGVNRDQSTRQFGEPVVHIKHDWENAQRVG
jgi:hypothetical protein